MAAIIFLMSPALRWAQNQTDVTSGDKRAGWKRT
jgi:hypothetical protein